MKRDNPTKHFLVAFVIAIALYAVTYGWIEHRRNRKGPWQVTFTKGAAGPTMIINQPWLGLTNVSLVFQGDTSKATNSAAPNDVTRIEFRTPRKTPFDVPFGQCIFEDLTFLPGTVTFRVLGHEIELLPRVLVIDRQEQQWKSGALIRL
jgi:hypothetical protein